LTFPYGVFSDCCLKFFSKNLKNNKAFGDDQVINEYMKTTSNQFVDIYEKLFNLIFDTGIIPESWLLGTIKHQCSMCFPVHWFPLKYSSL
jgi:hypothetical protein